MRSSTSITVKACRAPRKASRTVELQITDIIQRLALNSIVIAIEDYEREDLHGVTRAKRVKATNATWVLFKLAIDTLCDRKVECDDPPTKVEALNLLKRLIFVVPNNLDDASKRIAEDAITVLVALLADEQPGGFVN